MAESLSTPPTPGLWAVIKDAVARAPRRTRRQLLFTVVVLDGVIIALSLDIATGTNPGEVQRIAAVWLAMIGISVLSVALLLHNASQTAEGCEPSMAMRLRSVRWDRIFMALPVLGLVSAAFVAAAIGLMFAFPANHPWLRAFFVVVFGAYLWNALRLTRHTSQFLFEYGERQAEQAARAREELGEARLAALAAQLNPHFLFNALNTVASLVRTDARAAERTVENLADVLRRTLDRSQRPRETVEAELSYLQAYLAIEQARWGDRLRVELDVAPDTLVALVPPLVLQPLVENALKHGLGSRLEGGRVQVTVRGANGTLALAVTDDGVGFPARWEEHTGLGNLRRRLTTLYGDAGRLDVSSGPSGATVTVELPCGS